MHAHIKQTAEKRLESSFEITLDETLKILYERRLEINKLLRSLEAEKSKGSEQKLKRNEMSGTKGIPEPVRERRNTRRRATDPKSQLPSD